MSRSELESYHAAAVAIAHLIMVRHSGKIPARLRDRFARSYIAAFPDIAAEAARDRRKGPRWMSPYVSAASFTAVPVRERQKAL